MNKKIKTMSLQGNEYARVAERIKVFREDCPNGLIETFPTIQDKNVMFKARVLKDKSKSDSGEATGHSIGENKGQKAFEKLETIAIGRALAILGYMASGEIASSEEMEEFIDYMENKKIEAIASLRECKTLEELKTCFMGLGSLMGDSNIIKVKDELKLNLSK
jgi:hypothetical protein